MALKHYKPTTPSRRHSTVVDFSELTKGARPTKRFLVIKKQRAGRNHQGKITVRHQGGGHKQFYRIIDSARQRFDTPMTVKTIEYDPNRTAFIALVEYADKQQAYILAPTGMHVGDVLVTTRNTADIKVGNRLPLEKIPVGVMIHDLEFSPNSRGLLVRSAGTGALIQAVEGETAQVKLPSGEVRLFNRHCMATIGQVSNTDHENERLGKAGRVRWRGIRPSVVGKAMNPVDHPHGGGEGHNPIGLKHPKTPWGKPALGVKTRTRGKFSDRFIIKRRTK